MAIMLGTPGNPLVGFGSQTNGADDFPTGTFVSKTPGAKEVFTVDTLDLTGTGSITDALSEDGREIVFSVAGDIDFNHVDFFIRRSYLTIDGWSAPYPGITFINVAKLKFEIAGPTSSRYPVHDIIVKGIRCKGSGTYAETGEHRWEFVSASDLWEVKASDPDADIAGFTGLNCYRILWDHCTNEGAGNGNFELYGSLSDITVQNCFVHHSVQGNHMSLQGERQERVTYWNNVYGWVSIRLPRWRYGKDQVDYVGNVIYGWGWTEIIIGAFNFQPDGATGSSANVEKNTYLYIEGTDTAVSGAIFASSSEGTLADGYVRMHTDGANNLPSAVVLDDWRDGYFVVRDHSTTGIAGGGHGCNGMYQLIKVNTALDDWEIRKVNLTNQPGQDPDIEPPEISVAEDITIRTRGPVEQSAGKALVAESMNGDFYVPDSGDDSNIWSQDVIDSSTFQTELSEIQTSATRISMVYNGTDYIAPRTVPNIRKAGVRYPTAEEIEMLEIIATEAGQ